MGQVIAFDPRRLAAKTMSTARRPAPAESAASLDVLLRMHAGLEERVRDLEVQVRELTRQLAERDAPPIPPAPAGPPRTVHEHEADERARIIAALEAHRWNRSKAADALGIPRRSFYRKLEAYGIR